MFTKEQDTQIRNGFDAIDEQIGVKSLNGERVLAKILEGHARTTTISQSKAIDRLKALFGRGLLTSGKGILVSPAYSFLSLFAIIGLSISLGLQSAKVANIEQVDGPLRGAAEIFQLVADPIKAAKNLVDVLVAEKVSVEIFFESEESVRVSFSFNEKTAQILEARRIPPPTEDKVVLIYRRSD